MTNSRKRGRVALHGSEPMQTGLASKRLRLAAGHTESEGIAAACKFLDETASSDNNGHQEIDGLSAWTDKAEQCRPLFLLDLFCGTAGVAAAFRSLGGDALGMDHLVDKRRVKGPVAKVDLAQRASQDNILKWIVHGKVDGVMLAPPCGTSSRAREIPLPKRFRLRGGMQPAPMMAKRPAKLARSRQVKSSGSQQVVCFHQTGYRSMHRSWNSIHLRKSTQISDVEHRCL